MVKKSDFFLIATLLSFGIFFIYLYFYIENTQKEVKDKIVADNIKQVKYIFKNIEKDILLVSKDIGLVKYFEDKQQRDIFESKLSQMITPNVKYIYLLFLDKEEKFRFLLDGSTEDKARFYQKFDLLEPEVYKKLYKTKETQIVWQSDMENLWMTYLYPVKSKNGVLGILSVDMTLNLQESVLKLMEPLKNFFIVLIIFIFLLLSVAVIQLFRYFTTRKQLFHDPLTELFNRNYLKEVTPMINLENYSIAMLDLDRFKTVNDTYGHKAGDLVLHESAKIFRESIRDSDILIRYGGEEFLLFINKRGDDDPSLEVCDRIRHNISGHIFRYEESEIVMTLSIGLHQSPKLEKSLVEAIKKADSMLYIAKQRGRNQVVDYDEKEQNPSLVNRKGIDEVKQALDEDRVVCQYQPIIDPHAKEILKYEALVRIVLESGEIVYPGSFLPYLKHTNIHYKLTIRILTICFDTFAKSSLKVSINISFLDLMNSDIIDFIMQRLKEDKSLASRTTFEILESDEIEDITVFKEKIEIIHSLGAKIAIDDFGSGYSNFKAMLDIEADFLKIDGTLVKDITKNEKSFKVVKNIIGFAKDSEMKTVAEFVSSKEIYDKLMTLEIDYMQGFYLAKPTKEIVTVLEHKE
ncbi:MAG: bifunctional diguanylate cyclase/phosphodiesterase [Campylobacterota bacterium]|nr:bifunctional diguanylate cyclase/phosphodiesterase [Campylobacterota bacterium]